MPVLGFSVPPHTDVAPGGDAQVLDGSGDSDVPTPRATGLGRSPAGRLPFGGLAEGTAVRLGCHGQGDDRAVAPVNDRDGAAAAAPAGAGPKPCRTVGVRQAGDRAILLELDDAAGVRQVHAELSEDPVEGVADLVPGARTLLVVATRAGDGALAEAVIRARRATASEGEHASPSPVRIPVRYDGEDLPEVAARCGMPVSELIERHSGTLYTAAFLGLAPGFAYLTGLDPALRLPRRDSPRTAVPAGAVAVAGEFTGVYPRATPGGWHDRRAAVGPRQAAARTHHARRRRAIRAGPMSVPQGCFVVHSPGSLALVQDLGRPGYAALGVPHAGAADVPAYRLANRLVGNGEDAACLEVTSGGLAGEFSRGRWFALTGADADARLDGDPVAPNAPRYARPGQRLRLGHPRCGVRTYLAFAGGIDVPPVLGSRSADLMSGGSLRTRCDCSPAFPTR